MRLASGRSSCSSASELMVYQKPKRQNLLRKPPVALEPLISVVLKNRTPTKVAGLPNQVPNFGTCYSSGLQFGSPAYFETPEILHAALVTSQSREKTQPFQKPACTRKLNATPPLLLMLLLLLLQLLSVSIQLMI